MSRRVVTLLVGFVLLVSLFGFGALLPVPYAALGPGPTVDTLGEVDGKPVIAISGEQDEDFTGHLQLTTVGVRPGLNLFNALKGWIDGGVSVVPREDVYPPGKSEDEVNKENHQEIVQSQDSAVTAALGELGYDLQVVVQGITPESPAQGKLKPEDVLTSLDGRKVGSFEDLVGGLTAIEPGTAVTVGYKRGGKTGTTEITTTKAEDRKGSALGITVSTERDAPFDVNFSVGNIGGPSAGLMFALGIIEKVGDEDLTDGKFVAGTGTIDPQGKVGPIGGISLKLRGAKRDGATIFLVPKDNCAEALTDPPSGLRLVKVESLGGAVDALEELKAGGDPEGC